MNLPWRSGLVCPCGLVCAGLAVFVRSAGRAAFRSARLLPPGDDCFAVAEIMTPSLAAQIALVTRGDGLVLIPLDSEYLPAGSFVDFLSFSTGP